MTRHRARKMHSIVAFFRGVREFRRDTGLTYGTPVSACSQAYDWGREWMHRITGRRFDQ